MGDCKLDGFRLESTETQLQQAPACNIVLSSDPERYRLCTITISLWSNTPNPKNSELEVKS
eukprot:450741-Amphidinium_carterae.2